MLTSKELKELMSSLVFSKTYVSLSLAKISLAMDSSSTTLWSTLGNVKPLRIVACALYNSSASWFLVSATLYGYSFLKLNRYPRGKSNNSRFLLGVLFLVPMKV